MRVALLLPLIASFVACGPPKRTLNEPVVAAPPPEPEPPPPPPKPKKAEKKKPKGPFHWTSYAGPKVQTTITTPRAWAVIPVGLEGDWGVSKIALLQYIEPEGGEHVLERMPGEKIFVPQAMVRSAEPAKNVKKGAALLVNVAAASGFGRVTDVVKEGDADAVKFLYEWAGAASEAQLGLDQVVLLEDKVAFGHPVAVPSDAGGPEVATVIYTDKDATWVIRETGEPKGFATKDVKPMKVSKPLKKGDKVLAPSPFELKPGRISDLVDGARYKVKFDEGGKEETFSFHKVTPSL